MGKTSSRYDAELLLLPWTVVVGVLLTVAPAGAELLADCRRLEAAGVLVGVDILVTYCFVVWCYACLSAREGMSAADLRQDTVLSKVDGSLALSRRVRETVSGQTHLNLSLTG